MKYQLLKNGIPVAVVYSAEECDRLYLEYECDEVRAVSEDVIQKKENKEK